MDKQARQQHIDEMKATSGFKTILLPLLQQDMEKSINQLTTIDPSDTIKIAETQSRIRYIRILLIELGC